MKSISPINILIRNSDCVLYGHTPYGATAGSLGIKNGDVKIIKNAGAIISHPFGSVIRSLLVAIYELGVNEVMIIGHTDCGAKHMDSEQMIEVMKKRGILRNISI